jgi:hypothetical protein
LTVERTLSGGARRVLAILREYRVAEFGALRHGADLEYGAFLDAADELTEAGFAKATTRGGAAVLVLSEQAAGGRNAA